MSGVVMSAPSSEGDGEHPSLGIMLSQLDDKGRRFLHEHLRQACEDVESGRRGEESAVCDLFSDVTHQSYTRQFADVTSCHGLQFLFRSHRWWVKLMWMAVICSSSAFLIFQIVGLFQDYWSHKTYTKIKLEVSK